ncbi:hypothetical protein BOTBODRAFT_26960 [Botryobasidium botryosum FD-172 SS1]|uniref:Mid2 domain-containing protein n=1 Tax=Botryobasidium botryosum (strain FD-172 SS1) TaxID=930990 RepID=A0A067NA01_BOTB1|nr:hypothetical protein BOTBODRAFT_26960 [Botryobasidium botryosum FD-172 SS1]
MAQCASVPTATQFSTSLILSTRTVLSTVVSYSTVAGRRRQASSGAAAAPSPSADPPANPPSKPSAPPPPPTPTPSPPPNSPPSGGNGGNGGNSGGGEGGGGGSTNVPPGRQPSSTNQPPPSTPPPSPTPTPTISVPASPVSPVSPPPAHTVAFTTVITNVVTDTQTSLIPIATLFAPCDSASHASPTPTPNTTTAPGPTTQQQPTDPTPTPTPTPTPPPTSRDPHTRPEPSRRVTTTDSSGVPITVVQTTVVVTLPGGTLTTSTGYVLQTGSPSPSGSIAHNTGAIVGIVVGGVVAVLLLCAFTFIVRRIRQRERVEDIILGISNWRWGKKRKPMLEEEDFDLGDDRAWSGGDRNSQRTSQFSYGAVGSIHSAQALAHMSPEPFVPHHISQASQMSTSTSNLLTQPRAGPSTDPPLIDIDRPPVIPAPYAAEREPEHREADEQRALLDLEVGQADSFRDEVLAYDDHSRGQSLTSATSADPLMSPTDTDDMGRIKGSLAVRNV